MYIQRYVSPDLTHFVGRGRKTLKEQYRVLKKILKEGRLHAPTSQTNKREPCIIGKDRKKPYVLERDPSERLSGNEAYRVSVVCFCDIPVGDLPLHMQKYGCFGLAFSKDFLVNKGAMPVMYIPNRGRPSILPWGNYGRGQVSSNAVSFDEFWKNLQKLLRAVEDKPAGPRVLELTSRVSDFLDIHLLSQLKFFDPFVRDTDKANFYMEREWRISGDVKFYLKNVRRVIIPQEYAPRFRRDFPGYKGELVFID